MPPPTTIRSYSSFNLVVGPQSDLSSNALLCALVNELQIVVERSSRGRILPYALVIGVAGGRFDIAEPISMTELKEMSI